MLSTIFPSPDPLLLALCFFPVHFVVLFSPQPFIQVRSINLLPESKIYSGELLLSKAEGCFPAVLQLFLAAESLEKVIEKKRQPTPRLLVAQSACVLCWLSY